MFGDTLIRWLEAIPDAISRYNLLKTMSPLFDRMSSRMLSTAGLAIKTGGSTLVKSGASDAYGIANGILRKITAATDMPALVGTVTNAKFNVFCFFIDSGGTVTVAMGTEGAALANVVFPPFPEKKALIGFIVVNPTGTGNFVGGTTALDDGTVIPGVVYINSVSGFDPYCLIGS